MTRLFSPDVRWGARLSAALLMGAAIGAALLIPGCRGETEAPPSASSGGDEGFTQLDPEECEDLLSRAWSMVQPERLGVTAEPETAARTLNEWFSGCVEAGKEAGAAQDVPLELPESAGEQLAARRFTVRDAGHVRNAILHDRTNRFVAVADDDLGRVTDLFYYVVENVALPQAGAEPLPQTPFEVLLLGRGTAEDRAWVFAELLRQLRLDAVILRPQAADGRADRWLVGVLLDGEVYLFDPQLGLPVPSPEKTEPAVRIRRPATLAQAAESDDVLRQLDVEGTPYPLRADDLKDLRVELIGYSSIWAPRMRALQLVLAGDRSVVVYEPLGDAAMQTGLYSRVAAAGEGRWNADDLRVWSYPESQLDAAERLSADQSNRLQSALEPLKAPWPINRIVMDSKTGAITEVVLGAPERDQLKTRIQQLLGDFGAAIRSYMTIRMASRVPPMSRSAGKETTIPEAARPFIGAHVPEAIRALHREAAEDAYFWTGLCKRMQGNVEAAADTFAGYLEMYPDGDWSVQARYLRALMLAEQGQYADAADALEEIPAEHPQSHGFRLLQQRWRAMADADE